MLDAPKVAYSLVYFPNIQFVYKVLLHYQYYLGYIVYTV